MCPEHTGHNEDHVETKHGPVGHSVLPLLCRIRVSLLWVFPLAFYIYRDTHTHGKGFSFQSIVPLELIGVQKRLSYCWKALERGSLKRFCWFRLQPLISALHQKIAKNGNFEPVFSGFFRNRFAPDFFDLTILPATPCRFRRHINRFSAMLGSVANFNLP